MAALRIAIIVFVSACITEPSRPSCTKARALPEINVADHDRDPWLSPDRRELFFVSDRPGAAPGLQIWRATRDSYDGRFDMARQISGDFVSMGDVLSPSLGRDGLTLYFSKNTGSKDQLWSATRSDRTSTLFANTRLLVDDGRDPSLTGDERTVYFTRSFDQHIYRATRASTVDPFANATRVEELVTMQEEEDPFIDADDTMLTFTVGTVPTRIVRSHLGNAVFMPPDEVIETDLPDPDANIHSPMVHAGGRTIVFSSDVTGGSASDDLFITCE